MAALDRIRLIDLLRRSPAQAGLLYCVAGGDTGRAVSRENVEIVRRAFEASSEGDVGVWFQAVDPEIRIHPRPAEPDAADEYRGLDGLMDYLTNWYSEWDDYDLEVVELLDAGKHVLAAIRERGRVERTGLEVEEVFNHSFVLRDGKVLEWHMYDSRAEALEAVGLPA
jgi:ketosteroid isomerase-like protein